MARHRGVNLPASFFNGKDGRGTTGFSCKKECGGGGGEHIIRLPEGSHLSYLQILMANNAIDACYHAGACALRTFIDDHS